MSSLKSIKNNCYKAQQLGIKHQHGGQIGFANWLKLKYHLLWCNICRHFLKNAPVIDSLIDQHYPMPDQEQPPFVLTPVDKKTMQDAIDKMPE